MTSPVSAIEAIEKAMEGESIDRIAQNFHSCEDALPWGRQKSSYRGTVRKTVRSMIEAMRAAGFEVVSRRDLNSFARQAEALQRENDALLSMVVVASEALCPFAAAVFGVGRRLYPRLFRRTPRPRTPRRI